MNLELIKHPPPTHTAQVVIHYLINPCCSGMAPCVVDIPASTQVEPRRREHRTLTKSRGPTMFPGGAAAVSWVIRVSFPTLWRI